MNFICLLLGNQDGSSELLSHACLLLLPCPPRPPPPPTPALTVTDSYPSGAQISFPSVSCFHHGVLSQWWKRTYVCKQTLITQNNKSITREILNQPRSTDVEEDFSWSQIPDVNPWLLPFTDFVTLGKSLVFNSQCAQSGGRSYSVDPSIAFSVKGKGKSIILTKGGEGETGWTHAGIFKQCV